MIPRFQTIFAGPDGDADGRLGNCFAACIASVLEMPLENVPNFSEVNGPPKMLWWCEARRWLQREWKLDLACVDSFSEISFPHQSGYVLAAGPSPRGSFRHVVIVDETNCLAHDPHPSTAGLASEPDCFYAFCFPYEPTPDEDEAYFREQEQLELVSA